MASGKSFKGFQPNTLSGRESYFSSQNPGENKVNINRDSERDEKVVPQFTVIYSWMTGALGLDLTEATLLALIRSFHIARKKCVMSNISFQTFCHCSQGKLNTAKNRLIELNYITVVPCSGSTNSYCYHEDIINKILDDKGIYVDVRAKEKGSNEDQIHLTDSDCPW